MVVDFYSIWEGPHLKLLVLTFDLDRSKMLVVL